jgi:hypothetical protein
MSVTLTGSVGGPPPFQLGPWLGACVAGQLGEEPVDTQQVRQVGPIGEVRMEIGEIRTRIATIAGLVRQAHVPVRAASGRSSPQESVDVLGPVVGILADIQERIAASVSRAGHVHQHTARTLEGGRPGPMLAHLDGIRTVLVAVEQRCSAARRHVETALAAARQTGAGVSSSGDSGRTAPPDGKEFVRVKPDRARFVPHVESNATGYMRRNRIRQAVLYSNMRPCLGEDGCTSNIKATLPPGYKLTVYHVTRVAHPDHE